MLHDLLQREALPEKVVEKLDEAYEFLNRAVHGRPDTLINDGLFHGEWRGHSFKADRLRQWFILAKDCLGAGLVVLKQTSDTWLRRKRTPLFCDQCHACDTKVSLYPYRKPMPVEFEMRGRKITLPPSSTRPRPLYVYRCRKCNHVWHRTDLPTQQQRETTRTTHIKENPPIAATKTPIQRRGNPRK